MHVDRERVVRALAFFGSGAGLPRALPAPVSRRSRSFDRAIALASLAFSALIPLGIVLSARAVGPLDRGSTWSSGAR